MPFTPYHVGPGVLLKSAVPRHFSLGAYAAAQVAVDLESGYFLLSGLPPYHRTVHTFLVASAVGAAVGLLVGTGGRQVGDRLAPAMPAGLRRDLQPGPALVGGLVGGLMHVLLDAVMHADIRPLRPFSDANPLFRLVSLTGLHLGCLTAGVTGLLGLAYRSYQAEQQASGPG